MPLTRMAAAVLFAASLGWPACGLAQDSKPKDDALDKLLEKLEGKPTSKEEAAPKPKADKPKADAPKNDKPKAKPAAEPKDKALDSLLEKLGETKEAPTTEGKAESKSEDTPLEKKLEDAVGQKLDEKQKRTDKELERLTGRMTKEDREKQREAEKKDNSQIGQAVKKMREVEERLGQPDTGEETRKKQGEIVKDLDTLISQARRTAQMKMQQRQRRNREAGNPNGQPGDQDNQPGSTAQGTGPQAPKKPNNLPAMVGSKDIWGNLPAHVRDEMENSFSDKFLPRREKQIGRYFEALTKKSLSPGG